jgi:hypothetical protein
MNRSLIAFAYRFLTGCASSVHNELVEAEREGPGIWHIRVRDVFSDWSGALRMRIQGRPALAADEQALSGMSTDSLIFANPLKTHIGMTVKAKKSLALEYGDYLAAKDGYALLDAKDIPEVTTILCRNKDSASKDKITLGLKTKEGTTTTGSLLLLPFRFHLHEITHETRAI